MRKQRYELISGKSAKFWEVQIKRSSMTTAYGRIGTMGQSTTKEFASADKAKEAAYKLITQKVNKGYSKAPARQSKQSPKPKTEKRSTKKKGPGKTAVKKVNIADLNEREALKLAKAADTPQSDLAELLGRYIRVDRALAKRDDLSPISLEKLSHSSDRITRRNVAANANCATNTLLHLAPQFPAEFLANPLCDWMLIEDPSSFRKLDEKVLIGMFKRQDCPVAFLRWAADHDSAEVMLSLISNKQTPKDVLEHLALSRNKRVSEAARGHEKLAGEISEDELENVFLGAVRELLKNSLSNERQLKYIGLAQFRYVSLGERTAWVLKSNNYIDPKCPPVLLPSLLEKVSTSKRALARERAAEHPQCPAAVLKKLATDKDYKWDHEARWVQEAVAKNPQCPANVLKQLTADNSLNDWQLWGLHVAIAKHPNCPVSTLKNYQSQSDAKFRVAVAQNTSCPLEMLRELASDDTKTVRAAVAANVECPAFLLRQLAGDEGVSVRQSVARNPHCPAAALKKLAVDKDKRVRKIIEKSRISKATKSPTEKSAGTKVDCQSLVEKLTYDNWSAIRKLLATENLSSHLRRKVFAQIPDNGSEDVRKSAASDWGSAWLRSRALIKKLASDTRPSVRKAVASNSSCPTSVYQQLLKDIHAGVRREAALNVQHPVNVRLLQREPESSPWFLMQLEREEKKDPKLTAAVREGNFLYSNSKKALRGSSLVGRILALSQPGVPPAELARASGYRDWRQRMAIARNLATPPKVLERLSQDANRFVAAQASATLRQDEKKSKALASRIKTAKKSKSVGVDYEPLNQWIGDRLREDAGKSVTINTNQLLNGPVAPWATFVPLSAWWNPNSLTVSTIQRHWDQLYEANAPKLDEWLRELPASSDTQLMEKLARSPRCPAVLLSHLCSSDSSDVRKALAENPRISGELLGILSTDRSSTVRRAVAANSNCPPSILKLFASSRDRNLRVEVASNRKCPRALFDTLAVDDDAWVRSNLIDNQKLPAGLWQKMAAEKDSWIREDVAQSSACPRSVLEALSSDKSARVREAVARNDRCPKSTLEILTNDSSADVRWGVAENESTPLRSLERLASDRDKDVREAVAWNSKAPVQILEQLANDKNEDVRHVVAWSWRLPPECLEILARDKSPRVRARVAGNENTPVQCLIDLSTDDDLIFEKGNSIRQEVAGNPNCPADVLEQMYSARKSNIGDEIYLGRRILGHPNCSTQLVEEIAKEDDSPKVQKLAKAELQRRSRGASRR